MTPTHDQVARLLGAVKADRDIFWNYAQLHYDKGTEEGRLKAEANLVHCKRLEDLIAEIEAELAAEGKMYSSELTLSKEFYESIASKIPSLINACIRAAKKVIAALNLPEGAGMAMDRDGQWCIFLGEPAFGEKIGIWYPTDGGTPKHYFFYLPDTAIPTWPGDFRDSWITADTQEVSE